MKRITIFLYFLLVGCLLSSCDDESRNVAPSGYLYLGVEENNTVVTRAERPVSDEQLSVYIMNATGGDTVRYYSDYLKDVKGKKLLLPAGKYKVAVNSATRKEAAWEMPYYSGVNESVEVKNEEITQAQVVCTIANTKVTVSYDPEMNEYFTDYNTAVTVAANKLVYEKDETRAGYFTSGSDMQADLTVTNRNGNTYTLKRTFPKIKARTHYNLKYTISQDDGDSSGADFDITIDKDSSTIHCNIKIKEEDFIKNIPVLKVENMGEENQLEWRPYKSGEFVEYEGEHPILSLQIPAGIGSQTISVESERFDENSLSSLIEWEKIAELQKIDLYDRLLKDAYSNLSGDNIPKTEEKHTFRITIMDKLHQEVSTEFTFVVKPDVSVETQSASPFSTFAILKGKGSGEKYKFKIWKKDSDEASAKEIEGTPIQGEEEVFAVIVTDLEIGTEYTYKACIDEDEGEPVDFTTEGASELPGGNFDQWGKESQWEYPLGTLSSGETVSPFWSSGNNNFTKSLLSSVEHEKGYAANLQSTDVIVVKIAAGNMFTGNFERDNMGGEITFNRQFASRPTKLTGEYYYTPGTVDVPGTVTMPSGKKIVVAKDSPDKCAIYIALSKEPYSINTNDASSLFDLDVPAFKERIVAYGTISEAEEGATNGWKSFSIDLNYLQPNYTGTYYIVVMSSACKYGDYFFGSTKSNLKLDNFVLSYDYDASCLQGTEYEGIPATSIK